MLGRFGGKFDFVSGLGFRLAALLSLAILPIGLISVMQTLNLSREAERAMGLSLLGRTAAAAAGERALLQGAFGTADALGPAVLQLMDDPAACNAMMRNFVERSATYAFAGFVRMDGLSECNSGGEAADLSGSPVYEKFKRSQNTLMASTIGQITGRPVVVIAQPLYRDRTLLGYVAVSLTTDLLRSTHSSRLGDEDANIVTFDSTGEIVSSYDTDGTDPRLLLPAGDGLKDLLRRGDSTLRARSVDGRERIFAVVPIVPGLAHAVGSFAPEESGVGHLPVARMSAVMLPLALWAVSLAVAYFAVFRLVLRPVRELRSQMRRFAVGDRSRLPRILNEAPAEIADVSRTFHNMARILVRDEQQLEEAVAEKTVLLKEVHHRVKNNLQLIASIINMQSRAIDDPDAKRVLRSVQDRVASLATIYRNLYQAEHLDSVQADQLVADIVDQMTTATRGLSDSVAVSTSIEKLTLLPDQAVPLSLLATEALTNALKYAGPPASGGPAKVRVALGNESDGRAKLEITNTVGPRDPGAEGTGLGSQLIEAFAMQLDAEADILVDDDQHVVNIRFRTTVPDAQAADGRRPIVLTSGPRPGAVH